MKILIVGGGGREHALAWKVAQSPEVERIFVAPGNAGTIGEAKTTNIQIGANNISKLLAFARDNHISQTIVGPEAPLVGGIVDSFAAAGLKCFGPSKAAAQLEGSKKFAKDFLSQHNIPTAEYACFSDPRQAHAYLDKVGVPIVVKADGLAAGKGVTVASSIEQAKQAVDDCLVARKFGSNHCVVIEECLSGEEASFICMVDGKNVLPLASSQDHKARDDGDNGPNTGGMGAYSPAPVIDHELQQRIIREVIEPTVKGLQADGVAYSGFLYAGLMIASDGIPKVLEYNCRLGDPETQPILLRLQSDIIELINATNDGTLDRCTAKWNPRPALGVVMAAGGYPADYRKGDVISGLGDIESVVESNGVKVFHAGSASRDEDIVTAGGRVLCVTALGDNIRQAQQSAYRAVKMINWNDAYYRHDIGYRAVARELVKQI